jgi:hypothetical protein
MADEEHVDAGGEQPGAPGEPDEEELRRRLDEELSKLRVEDVLLQSVVSLINLTSRRIAKPDEQDLEQAQLGIEAIRALADLLPDEPAAQVREALSQLQVAYAREAGGDGEEGEEAAAPPAGGEEAAPASRPDRPSGLWTPPGSSG